MIVTTAVSFGITLFGIFSLYRDFVVDNFESLELSIILTCDGLYYSIFYVLLIVLGDELHRCQMQTLAIIRRWINLSIFDNLDILEKFAEKIENSTIVISATIYECNIDFLGRVSFEY